MNSEVHIVLAREKLKAPVKLKKKGRVKKPMPVVTVEEGKTKSENQAERTFQKSSRPRGKKKVKI